MLLQTRNTILAALAVAAATALATPVYGRQIQPPERHARAGDIYVRKSYRSYYLPDPGSDNRYFSDTKQPSYPLGSEFDAYRGGFELLPEARQPF
jgi:hypothetical protein